ncbi:MAG: PAS domain S-box protein [Spirochaetes bacterium]|nr:PAS domain S-box protein [Spirochaetota bacterium]
MNKNYFITEDFVENLLENLHEYIYIVTYDDGRPVRTFHSRSCKRITGYDAEEMEQNNDLWYQMIYEEDKEDVRLFINKIVRDKGEGTIEHRIIDKNGNLHWVMNSMKVMTDTKGAVQYLNGFVIDITNAKKYEEELVKLYRAVEQSPATVVITDYNGLIEYVNPKFVHLTGYTFEEVKGKNPRILKSGSQSAEFYKNLWETILSGEEWRGEFHNRKKNGEYYWEFASISPIRDSKGRITHFIAVKEDITQRKLIEEALRQREHQLRIRNEIMEKDLKLAQIIQRTFIPDKVPTINGIKIAFEYHPLDKVGGDYFSFIEKGDGSLGILQCDVAGHGVAAALFLSLVKSVTDKISNQNVIEPEKYLHALNAMLIEERQQFFITGVYADLHVHGSKVHIALANGGHPPQILYRASNRSFELVKSAGTVIGMIKYAKYETINVILESGDRLFIFTDGIPETVNPDKQMIGFEEGLIALFQKSHRDNLNEMLASVVKEVRDFANSEGLDDDILIIGVEAY